MAVRHIPQRKRRVYWRESRSCRQRETPRVALARPGGTTLRRGLFGGGVRRPRHRFRVGSRRHGDEDTAPDGHPHRHAHADAAADANATTDAHTDPHGHTLTDADGQRLRPHRRQP